MVAKPDIHNEYAWFYLDGQGELYVVRRCPTCQRFLKTGKVLINGLDDMRLEGWVCKQHGEIKPLEWGWLD